MARPKKAPHERRNARIGPFDMTEAERSLVEERALDADLSLAEYCRQRILSGRVRSKPRGTQRSLLVELSRVGNNVNQIARQVNRGSDHDPHHLDAVMAQLMQTLQRIDRH